MHNVNCIHETIIRDIVDTMNDGIKFFNDELPSNRHGSFKSIASASKGLTLVFPLIADRSLSIESLTMVAKAKERQCVAMLQMLFAAINVCDSKDGFDYISNFHKNLDTGHMTLDDFISWTDSLIDEGVLQITDKAKYKAIKEDFERGINYIPPSDINESSLMDYKIDQTYNGFNVEIVKESPASDLVKSLKDVNDIYKNQLLDSDVKKANELIPTMMTVRFVSADPDIGAVPETIIIGIKCKIYPVDTPDIINRIVLKNQDKNGLIKLIKATTREISFLKDLVFAIDKAKIDALSQSKRGSSSKLWKVLERRSIKSKIKRSLLMKNDASAITSICISQETVELLKKMHNLNIEIPAIMNPIMDSYNLMACVIVDESLEVTKWLWDTGDDMYELVSFTNLEKEASDSSYKKVVNLMTKIVR